LVDYASDTSVSSWLILMTRSDEDQFDFGIRLKTIHKWGNNCSGIIACKWVLNKPPWNGKLFSFVRYEYSPADINIIHSKLVFLARVLRVPE
jgi:hypothetical protein